MTIENANRLADMRRAHGYSQEELAEKLNLSRQAISKWERAESSPDTDNLIALAQLYGVTLDELLGLNAAPAADAAEYEVPAEDADAYEAPADAQECPEVAEPACPEADFPEEPAPAEPTLQDPLPNGSYYAAKAEEAAREHERRRLRFPYPLVVTLAYLFLGFCFHLWHPGWIIFLTIPLFYLPDRDRKPLRLLGNPVMITIIYLLLGTQCGWWHPGWLVFLLIPLLNAADHGSAS